VKLLIDLAKDGIYACGTLRSNRSGFPEALKQHLKKGLKRRGDYLVRQCVSAKGINWECNRKRCNRISVSLWQDNRPVTIVATNCDPNESTNVQRRLKNGTRELFPCPLAVALYNKYMGGVDHNDQLRGY
jgi:hypothetical protein